jgi:hypothetical protein
MLVEPVSIAAFIKSCAACILDRFYTPTLCVGLGAGGGDGVAFFRNLETEIIETGH